MGKRESERVVAPQGKKTRPRMEGRRMQPKKNELPKRRKRKRRKKKKKGRKKETGRSVREWDD